MGLPLLVAGIGTMYSGYMSYTSNKRNARLASRWANYNAALTNQAAEWNSEAIESLGVINSSLARMGAAAEAAVIAGVSKHNAATRWMIAKHNSDLLLSEINDVWGKADLDTFILDQQVAILQGSERAGYAASNVVLDIPGDSPAQREVDIETQKQLETHVIQYNAQKAVDDIMNKAASELWLGAVEAQNILWEGAVSAGLAGLRGDLSSLGITAQAAYDSAFAVWQGKINANQIQAQGSITSASYNAQANQALVNAAFQSGSMLADAYGRKYTADVGSGNKYGSLIDTYQAGSPSGMDPGNYSLVDNPSWFTN